VVKIQAFIFNWKGHEKGAIALENNLAPLVPVTVINSDETLRAKNSRWCHLTETAYFSEQWNTATGKFDADVIWHVQADAGIADPKRMLARATLMFDNPIVGIYEPFVDFTDIRYDLTKLRMIAPSLYQVPLTDCTCWFIAGSVLRAFPRIDIAQNRFGWGVPAVMAAIAMLQGKICLRDHSLRVDHPRGRGYSSEVALAQRLQYVQSLPPDLREATARCYRQFKLAREALKTAPGKAPPGSVKVKTG
jgi:hypothetical protein